MSHLWCLFPKETRQITYETKLFKYIKWYWTFLFCRTTSNFEKPLLTKEFVCSPDELNLNNLSDLHSFQQSSSGQATSSTNLSPQGNSCFYAVLFMYNIAAHNDRQPLRRNEHQARN